jgi:hypothetical protein
MSPFDDPVQTSSSRPMRVRPRLGNRARIAAFIVGDRLHLHIECGPLGDDPPMAGPAALPPGLVGRVPEARPRSGLPTGEAGTSFRCGSERYQSRRLVGLAAWLIPG